MQGHEKSARGSADASPLALRGAYPAIDRVCPPLEGLGKTPESRIEHRAHQHGEHAAFELIGDEKLNFAGAFAERVEIPPVLHPAERAVQVLDPNLQIRPIECHAAGERLADELVGD